MKLFRPIFSTAKRELARRLNSTSCSNDLVKLSINEDTGFATVSMSRPPVNGLNLELLSSLHSTITSLEKSSCRGMILTSNFPTVFSAGLDLMELISPDMDRFRQFFTTLQDTWIKLYLSPLPTVAAINGHSPAGGCLLAVSCDYRIMVAPQFTIGLNEVRLGIMPPYWLMASMENVIGTRKAEQAVISGRMFPTEEAHKIGLVDEIASNKEEALEKAEDFLNGLSNLPPMARSFTKIRYRQDTVSWLLKNRENDIKDFLYLLLQPSVQQGLQQYLASLKKKASK